jgi:hypothetical protein
MVEFLGRLVFLQNFGDGPGRARLRREYLENELFGGCDYILGKIGLVFLPFSKGRNQVVLRIENWPQDQLLRSQVLELAPNHGLVLPLDAQQRRCILLGLLDKTATVPLL